MIKSTTHQEHTRTTVGAFWVSTQSQCSTQETLQMTNIFVPSNASRFQAAGGVSVQLPKGSDLRVQIDRLKEELPDTQLRG